MRVLMLMLVLYVGISSAAPSNPTAPNTEQGERNKPDTQRHPESKTGSQPQPVPALPGGITVIATGGTNSQPQGGEDKTPEWGTLGVAFLAWLVAIGALYVTYRQMRMFEIQLEHMKQALGDSAVMANAANASANAALLQLNNSMEAERGYVKISHNQPGISFADDDSARAVFEVKNWGRTVATVSDVQIEFKKLPWGDPMPIPYPFSPRNRESFPNGILVSHEYFFTTKYINKSHVLKRDSQLWAIGYVDYSDIYGRRWRGGYARKFVDQKGDNLLLNTESRDNFDRERIPGEGYDWDEQATKKYYERHPSEKPPA